MLCACAAIVMVGCGSGQKVADPTPKVMPRAQQPAEEPETLDPVTQQRLAQAQRDVQQYLRQRDIEQDVPGVPGSGLPGAGLGEESMRGGDTEDVGDAWPEQTAPARRPRKQVIFNDPPGRPSPSSEERPAIATPDDHFEPSPLFRDPVDDAEVTEQDDSNASDAGTGLAPDRLRQLLVDLRRELYIEGAHSDQPLRQLLPIAAMSMVDPEAAINPEAVPDLTGKERELLAALQAFFTSLGERLDGSEDVEEAIAEGVKELRAAVVQEPRLQLPTLALCYRVDGFGKYESFDRYSFLAHSKQQVIVYVEIDDFTSEVNDAGEWVTELSQKITIYSDRDGIPVWRSGDMQTAIDRAHNKRHDFFLLQIIALPEALSVGKYQLKVHVRDEKSGAEAEDAVEFEMVADPKLAVQVP